ncbi:transcription factor EGL1 [Olea europaea subsp. europaea]|uniref:Transcription factor EGL1 n=1 Tax=Olea europaea subsp. europaea TaxID=158383 RepID=A0A8S0UEL7_OLEEU|nr:transcription factor EGL1 [Olea europaea subsp. europaea]
MAVSLHQRSTPNISRVAMENQSQEEVPENLKKQLAIAVRSIEWSYAIFWSISSEQPGVLKWGDGYYNGDIKTRKTVQAEELNSDQLGLQRSEQLRELYTSLSAGETNPQAKRPTAALSPEDLTDAEWYYLVCMSFAFNVGQGLPGKTLAKNQTIWLCNAHQADTKVFIRSLLAKSASIQTVVCFPHLGGVVELGATELVLKDKKLIQNIKTSFLEVPYPNVSKIPDQIPKNVRNDNGLVYHRVNVPETSLNQLVEYPEVNIYSPNNGSNDFGAKQPDEELNIVEDIDGEASQMQSWQFMDDKISNCVNNSANSSDCISQTCDNPEDIVPVSNEKKVIDNGMHDTQESGQQKLNSSDSRGDDIHYHSVLSNLLKSSQQLILGPYFGNSNKESSFISWRKDRLSSSQIPQTHTPQRLLKKVLIEVARMHENCQLESSKGDGKRDGISKPEIDEIDRNHVLSERKRREKINERFLILGSLVPSGGKVDKISVLDRTIERLRELEKRIEELESNSDVGMLESRTRIKPCDAIERTSDNYGSKKSGNSKKPLTKKRKAYDMEEPRTDNGCSLLRDSLTDNITINVVDKDVLIEMKCPWRESVLLEVMEATSKLHLDSQSVRSSNTDGILSLTIKAQFKGSKTASTGLITQAIQKVIRRC